MYKDARDYDLLEIRKSNNPVKKYDAILRNIYTRRTFKMPFGGRKMDGTPYEQFKDRTPLKLYSKYDHGDENRRQLYLKRHNKKIRAYSPDYFSKVYLWSVPTNRSVG